MNPCAAHSCHLVHLVVYSKCWIIFLYLFCLSNFYFLSPPPLSALGQIMLYVDGMNGVIGHAETIQWLYTLVGSKV